MEISEKDLELLEGALDWKDEITLTSTIETAPPKDHPSPQHKTNRTKLSKIYHSVIEISEKDLKQLEGVLLDDDPFTLHHKSKSTGYNEPEIEFSESDLKLLEEALSD